MSAQERTPDDDLADQVCAIERCINKSQQGTIYCYHHLHGDDVVAPAEAIAAKIRIRERRQGQRRLAQNQAEDV